jgi:hypothetical protein
MVSINDLFSVPEPESDLLNAEQELFGVDEDKYLHENHTALEVTVRMISTMQLGYISAFINSF